MAFTKQGGSIEQALISGGLNPMAANAVMYAIANCAQPLEHRGPFTINYVPQQVRLQTPEAKKYSFPDSKFVTSEGERRPYQKKQSDECQGPNPPQSCFDNTGDNGGGNTGDCGLADACDRLDQLEEYMRGVLETLQQIADALEAAREAVAKLQDRMQKAEDRIQRIEDFLKNTTACEGDNIPPNILP